MSFQTHMKFLIQKNNANGDKFNGDKLIKYALIYVPQE